MEATVNKFEEELLNYTNRLFQSELDSNMVEIEVSTPEYAKEQDFTYKGWAIGIRKKRETMRDVRVVIRSPDPDLMNEVADYRIILKRMAEMAKQILDNPPYSHYISQGAISTTSEGQHVAFISKDDLRRTF